MHHDITTNIFHSKQSNWFSFVAYLLAGVLLVLSADRIFAADDEVISQLEVQVLNPTELSTTLATFSSTTSTDSFEHDDAPLADQTTATDDIHSAEVDGQYNTDAYPNQPVGEIDVINAPTNTLLEEFSTINPFTIQRESDALVSFSRQQCVEVTNGNFYCQQSPHGVEERPDGVYAFPDQDGDMEIFIQRNGALSQITFNQVDDSAPFYDVQSHTIVWHRLINDRYQIVSYDVRTQQELIITEGDTNNMEPCRSGEYITWQSWIDNNWEIVLYDGKKLLRITHSPRPDVAPRIKNGLLIWTTMQMQNKSHANIYNISTGEYIVIEDPDGGVIDNPRMVILYETTNSVGDAQVRGYDILTGEVIIINNNQPTPRLPAIPPPQPVTEPVAFLSTSNKNDITNAEWLDPDTDLENEGDAYEIDEYTLILNPDAYSVSTDSESEETLYLADLTLDMRPSSSSSPVYEITIPTYVHNETPIPNDIIADETQ